MAAAGRIACPTLKSCKVNSVGFRITTRTLGEPFLKIIVLSSMRFAIALLCLAAAAAAQTASLSPAGKWVSNLKFFEEDDYDRMELNLSGTTLTGKLGSDVFSGTFQNGRIEGTVKPNPQRTIQLRGRLDGDRIEGTAIMVEDKLDLKWEAQREPPNASATPKTHTFEPTQFYHYFSGAIEPALHVSPGDTVKTWSVDAGGTDPKGVRRTSGGNPLTGPFYIDGALPGDTLIVHFNRLHLNRDTAISSPLIVNGALNPGYVEQRKRVEGYDSDWKLDRDAGFASLQKPTAKLKDYRVPLAPMIGCIGVAPPGGMQYRSGFLGSYGGNMDYNQVREGITVYLPVYVPGALLFVGDGHALQGAGELTGNALETSMDIELTVNLERGAAPPAPRMENADYLMASGIAGSLDEALRGATTSLVRWLEKKYGLNAAEVSSVLGTSMVYDVAEVVDPAVHVVAKVPKSVLVALKPAN
jgi:amidase